MRFLPPRAVSIFACLDPSSHLAYLKMTISVTEFKAHCLDIVRRVEATGEVVTITRRGKVVARLSPCTEGKAGELTPWERLQALGGKLLAAPEESVLLDEDFEALR